jgi:hypothetical protein
MTLATARSIERTKGHMYTLLEDGERKGPFPGVTAITGFQDSVGGSDGLLNWAVNLALEEVYRRLPGDGGEIEEDHWAQIRSAAFQAKNQARDLGSAVHSAIESVNRGLPVEVTDRTAPYVAQYGAWFIRNKVEVIAAEQYVVNPEVGYGGTFDLLCKIDGETVMLDVKSGKAKPSQRLQLAALSWAPLRASAGMEAEPMPLVDSHMILLVRPDGCEPIRHDITDEDRAHFAALVETYRAVWAWRESQEAA